MEKENDKLTQAGSQQHGLKKKISHLRNQKEKLEAQCVILDKKISYLENLLLREGNLIESQGPGVYVVKCHNLYKIGMAVNLKKRMSGLQTSCPYPLKIVAFIPCNVRELSEMESYLHKTFGLCRIRGEWFSLDKNHIRYVMTLADMHRGGHLLHDFIDVLAEPLPEVEPEEEPFLDPITWVNVGNKDKLVLIKVIQDLLATREERYVSTSDVVSECILRGVGELEARDTIDRMRRDGDLFEPRPGMMKLP